MAHCTFSARRDARFTIYPKRYEEAIAREVFGQDFWMDQVAAFDNYSVDEVHYGGVGRGHASFAGGTYQRYIGGQLVNFQAMMAAALYYDLLYVVHCAVRESRFGAWQVAFQQIISSTDFDKRYADVPKGYYFRDFMADPEIQFGVPNGLATMRY